MNISELNTEKEGFAVLFDSKKVMLFENPIKKLKKAPENIKDSHCLGYIAYPNPNLKNDIPEALFYQYSKKEMHGIHTESIRVKKEEYTTSGKLEQSVSKAQYIKKINEIKELLAQGEVYQINYAIRFRKKFKGSPYSLFLNLLKENPTEFSAFINCGDYQIISNSPERLFKVEGQDIITQPIKGTVSKKGGQTALKKFLASEKERAELDMITDLERNDIGRICKYGTLKLTKERELMELKNLYHTYSEVRGKLPEKITNEEIITAMFPGGSITGCPKKRAMEYIEKLEALPRNIFTGSIFYAKENYIDSNICIRTALVHNGYIEYWAGGGIVADSVPEKEYDECLLKAQKFLDLI